MTATIYGIKNCDTVKKALRWLEARGVDYRFHDYKKDGVPQGLIERALKNHAWDKVINTRGTTWRQLPDSVKAKVNADNAAQLAYDNPSIIKRPLLEYKDSLHVGFDEALYESVLQAA